MDNRATNTKLEQALYLREKLEWSIIPVGKDKKPLIEWKEYQTRKPKKEEVIAWFEKYPDANIGVITGKESNLVVVDIDPRHGGTAKEFNRIITVQAKTGGDGEHYYFLYEEGVQNRAGLRPGIDIRGEGGFAVVPPSIHASGKPYEWIMSPHANTPIIPLPSFIKAWIKNAKTQNESNWNPEVLKGVEEGKRNESAASLIGKLLHLYPKKEWTTHAWDFVIAWNDKNSTPLSIHELKSVFNSIASRERSKQQKEKDAQEINESAGVSENGNDVYKRRVKFELSESKLKIIKELQVFNYRTSPFEIAKLLEQFFFECGSQKGHWIYIAQQYTPRTINRVIKRIIKLHNSGRITIQNPAAYFTYLIKLRKRRRVNSYH